MANNKFDDILPADDKIGLGLLNNHIHFLTGEVDEINIEETIRWIVYENLSPRPDKILTLYINSTGGSLCDAFALIDIMRSSQCPIRTVGVGSVMSAAFLIFASGTQGQRYIAKNASILSHQFSEGMDGKYHDIKAQMRESENTNKRMLEVLKESTGLNNRVIRTKLLPPSDVWLTVEEVINLGVADKIL